MRAPSSTLALTLTRRLRAAPPPALLLAPPLPRRHASSAPRPPPLVTFGLAASDRSVGVLTLNNPAALNALSLAVADDLDAAVAAAAAARVRAVVVTGAGRAFSAGGDMAFLRARAAAGAAGEAAANAAAMRGVYARFLNHGFIAQYSK